jgi:hypothetical protein
MRKRSARPATEAVEALHAQTIPADAVIAVYRALLGRSPDSEGLAHWTTTRDLEQLVRAVSDTDDHRRRVVFEYQADIDFARDLDGAAARLAAGDGLVPLDERSSLPGVLGSLPWEEVADPWAELPALVLGPYGRLLAEELVRRGHVRAAGAGFSAVTGSRIGTLVLTDELYARALDRLRPDVLSTTVLRILHPVSTRPGAPVDEREAGPLVARRRLHALGFVEVSRVFARRHGADSVVLDTTFTMPVPGELLTVPGTPLTPEQLPATAWLVARRVPVGDRV